MSASNTVSVHYRHVELSRDASLQAKDDGTAFLSLESPLPVRTVLSLAHPDGSATAVEVVQVIEVPSDGAPRGCVVKTVTPGQVAQSVGTERLGDGAISPERRAAGGEASGEAGVSDEDHYGAHMAVPAPVISEDTSEPHEVGEADAGDDDAEPGEGNGNGEGSDAAGNGDGGDATAGRAKKRRGRKRK